jgi:hypothetical protein
MMPNMLKLNHKRHPKPNITGTKFTRDYVQKTLLEYAPSPFRILLASLITFSCLDTYVGVVMKHDPNASSQNGRILNNL